MDSVLITGGCGFMGSHVVRHFSRAYPDHKLVNLDLLTYAGNLDNIRDIGGETDGHYEFIRGDVCDSRLVERLFEKYHFTLVVHLAAETHVDRSIFNVSDFIRTNVEGTRVLLEAVRMHKVPHMVHVSTDEVYGNISNGFSVEDAALNPSNPYAASKAAGDMLARTYRMVYGTPVSIVRSGNNYGSHQYPEKFIPLVITNLIADEKIPVHGGGGHVRSWVYVDDFCKAIDRIAYSTHAPDTYNVAGEHRTNLEIIELVARYLRKNHEVLLPHTKDRPAADLRYAPDASKIERKLGWGRRHSIDEVMGYVVDWYLKNKAWWLAIKSKKEFLHHYEIQSKAQWY